MPTYTNKQFKEDLMKLNNLVERYNRSIMMGGGERTDAERRSFTIVKVDGKKLDKPVGRYIIKNMNSGKKTFANPGDAAKKAARAYSAKHKDKFVKGNKFVKFTLTLKETTRGTSHKLYGPYEVTGHVFTSKEYKELCKVYNKKFSKMKSKSKTFKPRKFKVSIKALFENQNNLPKKSISNNNSNNSNKSNNLISLIITLINLITLISLITLITLIITQISLITLIITQISLISLIIT